MEARLEQDWMRDSWRIWIADGLRSRGARRIYALDEHGQAKPEYEISEQASSDSIPPTLILPTDFLRAIVTAANEEAGLLPPDRAMAAHLGDARGMRDRLLTMIERGVSIRAPK